MSKVYQHHPLAPDKVLGRVEPDGKVYESRIGLDKYIGRVDLETGKILESRFGPDKYIGRVELEAGKVYLTKFGPDKYVGRVEADGKVYHHKRMARDEYLGRVDDMLSPAHGAAAFLLLLLPTFEELEENGDGGEEKKDTEQGKSAGRETPARKIPTQKPDAESGQDEVDPDGS